MFCRNFCGNVAPRDDSKPGTERVPQDRSERDNVHILPPTIRRGLVVSKKIIRGIGRARGSNLRGRRLA
jgi:hypothetical protein